MTIFSLPTFSYTPPPPSPLLHTLGARVGVRPPPLGGRFATFSPCGSLIATFFSLRGTYFTMWGPFWCIFLLVWNLFYHVGAFLVHFSPYGELFLPCGGLFSPCGGLWLRFHPYWDLFFTMWVDNYTMWGTFCYVFLFIGNLFYHVVAFLLLFSPFGVLFCTYGERFCTYTWGLFVHMGGRPFLYIWGAFWAPPPRTNIPARPRVPIAIPHHIIMPAITRHAKLGQIQGVCRGPSKIRQRGGCNNFLLFTR